MRIATVLGTRPQLIKAAALQPALRDRHHEVLIDTGQHYDAAMAGSFFDELGIAAPDHRLEVHGGGHGAQTGRMMLALEPLLESIRPDAVLVFGDTNSTLAGALVAAKLGIRVAHVEAGLRSFDRAMPEELNRVVVDHLASWSFAPTAAALDNLRSEGIVAGVHLVGDLMQDLTARLAEQVRTPGALAAVSRANELELHSGDYLFATIHRAENRATAALRTWSSNLAAVAAERSVVLALHPGTAAALAAAGITLSPQIKLITPQGYRSTLTLTAHAAAVLSDSGGLQREAAWLRVPCLVLRERTEWVESLADSAGRMVLVGLQQRRWNEALTRLAPSATASATTVARLARLRVEPAGAAEAVSAVLAADAA